MIPYIGPKVVEALTAKLSSPEPAPLAFHERLNVHESRKVLSNLEHFPHTLSSQPHSNAWVTMIWLVTHDGSCEA